MRFALSDEQRALEETVRDWLADRFGLDRVRAVYDDPAGDGDPDELRRGAAEQGLLAVTVPEKHDGLGLGLLEAAVVARALGAGVAPGPVPATLAAVEAIRLAGSDEQQGAWLARIAAGEARAALAVRRDGGAWDGRDSAITINGGTINGGAVEGATLRGSAQPVDYAHVADVLVVAAGDGSWHLVETAGDGVSVERLETLDRTARPCRVHLDGAVAQPLPGASPEVVADVVRRASVLAAADLAGVAREALARTVAYDKERVQFGRPVGSFQALKHDLANLHTAVTMANYAVLYAAHAVDADLPDRDLMVHVAKAKASDAARDATAAMIQYHGGIGYTWEHDAHFFYKRAKRLEYAWGDATWHRERIARLVVDASPSPA